jgi:hypothetical protein
MCVVLGWGQWEAFEVVEYARLKAAMVTHLREHGGQKEAILEIKAAIVKKMGLSASLAPQEQDLEEKSDSERGSLHELHPDVLGLQNLDSASQAGSRVSAPPARSQMPIPQPRQSPAFQPMREAPRTQAPYGYLYITNVRPVGGFLVYLEPLCGGGGSITRTAWTWSAIGESLTSDCIWVRTRRRRRCDYLLEGLV